MAERLLEAEVAGVGDEGLGVGVAQDILSTQLQLRLIYLNLPQSTVAVAV